MGTGRNSHTRLIGIRLLSLTLAGVYAGALLFMFGFWQERAALFVTSFTAALVFAAALATLLYKEALQKGLATAHAAFERMTDAYIEVDSAWHVRYLNPRARILLASGEIPYEAHDFWDTYPEFASFFQQALASAMRQRQGRVTRGYYPPADAWLEIYTYPIKPGLALVIRDFSIERELSEESRHMNAVLNNLSEGVIAIDRYGKIRAFNKTAEQIFNYKRSELLGKSVNLLMPEAVAEAHDAYINRYLITGDAKIVGIGPREVTARRRDGSQFPLDLSVNEIQLGDERLFVGVIRDITERIRAKRDLEHKSNYDILTDLPNRSLLRDRLNHAITLAQRDRRKLALLFIDLDYFKEINDSHGHAIGDQVLVETAQRILQCIRRSDMAARLGGDEFVVILEGLSEPEEPIRVAEAIIKALNRPIVIDDAYFRIGCSVGIALFPRDAHKMDSLLQAADEAMYQAKKKGRNRYCFAEGVTDEA